MSRKKKLFLFLSGAVVSMILTSVFLASPSGSNMYTELSHLMGGRATTKLMKIEKIIEDNFMGDIHTDYHTDLAARAYVGSLGDKYSTYFPKNEFERVNEKLDGDYRGIGIQIKADGEKVLIESVMKGFPAEKAGLKAGDCIIKYNGKPCSAENIKAFTDDIKNTSVGEDVLLVIERDGTVFDVVVRVEDVELDYIKSEMLENNIGYVRIETFGNDVAGEFEDEVTALTERGATSLIFDLRSNPGGSLSSVVDMVDFLVGEGTITTVRQKDGKEQVFTSDEDEINLPMCVLINSESASASEIFSAALSDYGKATLIGEKTFGKGVVQGIFELGDGTAVSLTIAKYYTPKDVCIDGVGVSPDIEVSLPEDMVISEYSAHIEGDVQMSEALRVLGER